MTLFSGFGGKDERRCQESREGYAVVNLRCARSALQELWNPVSHVTPLLICSTLLSSQSNEIQRFQAVLILFVSALYFILISFVSIYTVGCPFCKYVLLSINTFNEMHVFFLGTCRLKRRGAKLY